MDHHTKEHLHEESLGGDGTADHARHPFGADRWFTVKPMLFGGYFDGAIHVLPANERARTRRRGIHRSRRIHVVGIRPSGPSGSRRWGSITAWWFFLKNPALADSAARRFKWLHTTLVDKYGFDWFNEHVIMVAARLLGGGLWRFGDQDS